MSQNRPALNEPTEIAGRYEVIHKLGAGAFGTVYKAKDKLLGRMMAIKTIRLEGLAAAGAGLDEMLERFQREARVSAQLKHPNIVTIYDIGESEGLSYLAMEFIDGMGLDKLITGVGRMSVERAASIGAQVADALDFAHKNSVVHRDIKPANIMIEAGDRVKVTDFGIAKVMDSGDHLTVTGSLLGTPSYMSPEQARGGTLDGRSDLFAVGCVLYEMLTGKKAFRGDSITGLIFKIITEEPTPLQEADPNIPESMVRIIAKALSKSPDGRYQTGRELADDLLAFTRPAALPTIRQVETPTMAVPLTAMIPPTPTVAGPPPTVASPPPTRVSPPRAVPPPTPPRPAAAPPVAAPSPQPAAPPRKSNAGIFIALALVGLMFLGIAAGAGWFFFLRKPVTTAETTTGVEARAAGNEPTAPQPAAQAPAASSGEAAQPAPAPPAAQTSAPAAGEAAPPAGRSASRPAGAPPAAATRAAAGEVAAPPASGPERSFLDEEPEEDGSGAEAGRRLAEGYRSDQGRRSGGTFGASGRFRARERSPRNLGPVERPAVAALRHVMNAEEIFHNKTGHYGTIAELATAQALFLDVPAQARSFARKNYRFELTVEEDGFKVTAIPVAPGLRPFVGDDSGYIRTGTE